MSFVETEDGSLAFDSPSMRAIAHDIIGVKTLLFRLQGILQNVSASNPFVNMILTKVVKLSNRPKHRARLSRVLGV